jgi:hypothetical protein
MRRKGRGNDCARKGGGFQIAKRAAQSAWGIQPPLLNPPLTIKNPPLPRKPQKPSHFISLLPSIVLNYL